MPARSLPAGASSAIAADGGAVVVAQAESSKPANANANVFIVIFQFESEFDSARSDRIIRARRKCCNRRCLAQL
jgi:GMP synthase-like glutamine amidotransferase